MLRWLTWWFSVLALVAGCYEAAPADMDSVRDGYDVAATETETTDNTESETEFEDSDTPDLSYDSSELTDTGTTFAPVDSSTDTDTAKEVDTLFVHREPSDCDDLGWDDCLAANAICGRMYLEAVHFIEPVGVSSSCEKESLFYGCAPLKYCYKDIYLAFDPDGRCWLMPTGCLPSEPGWVPAIDDEWCRTPVWEHSCVE
ncbi:MAG: hypothetical protein JXR76_24945 [Deltaproteobacteria bacterium]|nr:hypothetical protein [Deltaproteobacteria bacterium]